MKIRLFGFLGLALVVCLASAIQAQDEQRGRGQRGGRQRGGGFGGFGGGFGGFRGGGPQGGGAMQLMGLLNMEEVRKEVGLDDEIWTAIPDEAKRPDFRGMRDASEEERQEMLSSANQAAQDTLDEVLEPEGQRRLMGLLAQQVGYQSVMNELIAKEIGLDEAGMAKAREAAEEAGQSLRDQMREIFQGMRDGGGDREGMREKMAELMKKPGEAIAATLTDGQKQKFEELQGEKFEFPQRGPGMFGRGGFGGRGPGGAGGPGQGRGQGGPGGRRGGRRGGDDNGN